MFSASPLTRCWNNGPTARGDLLPYPVPGGKVIPQMARSEKGRTFGTGPMRAPRINLLRIEEELSEVHLRLARVTLENLPWQEFLRRYDKPKTLFYLDPPYFRAPFYAHNMELTDYREMALVLGQIKSPFILSINDLPEMREVFGGFKVRPVTLKYSAPKQTWAQGRELLISNF